MSLSYSEGNSEISSNKPIQAQPVYIQPVQTQQKPSLGREVYSDAIKFGKGLAIFSFVISLLVSVTFIIFAIYTIYNNRNFNSAIGKVMKDSTCLSFIEGDRSCTTTISYKDQNGKEYNEIITTSDKLLKNENIKVWYSTNAPNKPEVYHNSNSVAYMLLFLAVLIPLFAYLWVWATRKSNFAAAGLATISTVRLLT